MIESDTKLWTRNKSDEIAVGNGCWFDVARGAWAVWWIERYCKLYEGEWAGENMLIRSGCEETDRQILDDWDDGGKEQSIERAGKYAQWVAEGNSPDWQYECFMRLFGWVKHSVRWDRIVRRFTSASIWIPKKQKKSPSLASIGVYLTCGDGEKGAKCFGGAKDGNQAGIAMAHAIAMIEQSPELSSECKINRNEKSIEHVPTRSKYKPLSSANERSKNSKEGINGHILIDETHVVDRDFISIISRAGISRAEPLHIEVSTAGSNPEGYGKERQDYARLVLSGLEPNDSMFVAIYEAPQDLTDAELDSDPIKYGKLANPAWGHTAHEEEFLADYKQSKRTLTTLADFKMYRLNIWQATSSPWINMDQWDACGGEFSDWSTADAIGGGIDLGARDDLAVWALAAKFNSGMVTDEGSPIYRYEIKCQSFIADDSTRDLTKPPFVGWCNSGLICKTRHPINALRESLIKACLEHGVYAVAYDPYNAQQIAEDLSQNGITAARMAQNFSNFNEPIKDFVKAIADGLVCHGGDPLLRWCSNNATIYKDRNDRCMFDKKHSNEKIDALVAATMAFRLATLAPARATGSLFIV
jgi:phage terminase large subunit-like protein